MNERERGMNSFCAYLKQKRRLIHKHTDDGVCVCLAVCLSGGRAVRRAAGALCSCRLFYVAVCPVYVLLPPLSSPLRSALMAAGL